ncbi:MAG: hypothetical protein GX116_08255 [Fibrobacter sp.]|jgi:hypothetical protein|nr:hypothetical protein [Fibrobacter sp.]
MRLIFILVAIISINLFLAACSKKEMLFVPLKLDWVEYSGDLNLIDSSLIAIHESPAIDSIKTQCFVKMTQNLLSVKTLQKEEEAYFSVQYYPFLYKNEIHIHFTGVLANENQLDLHQELLKSTKENTYFWTAVCDPKLQIKSFQFTH